MNATLEPVSYLQIEISDRGMTELKDGRPAIFIPREKITRIELRYGSGAERPVLQGIAGGLLTLLGSIGVFSVIAGNWGAFRWSVGFVAFGALGVWLFWETILPRYYLQVVCERDRRKLLFKGVVQEAKLAEFLAQAAAFGYGIADCRSALAGA